MKMSKLHSLRNWYSLEDAAKRLSITLAEELKSSDVLQLAIEGHIPLSLNTRHLYAVPVVYWTRVLNWDKEYISFHEKFSKIINSDISIKYDPSKVTHCSESFEVFENIKSVSVLSEPMRLELELCGALKDWFVAYQCGVESDLVSLEGYFLRDNDGRLWQVMESFPRSMKPKEECNNLSKTIYDIDNYCPSSRFPDIGNVGFQRQDLECFENSLKGVTKPNGSASTKEKESLLTMIIAMSIDCYGHNSKQSKNSTTADIKKAIEMIGLSLNDDTIRKWLKESEKLLPKE